MTDNITIIKPSKWLKFFRGLERNNFQSSAYDKLLVSQIDGKYLTLDYQGEVFVEEFETMDALKAFYNIPDANEQLTLF